VHVLTLAEPLETRTALRAQSMPAGSYLVEDRNAWELAYMAKPGTASVREWRRLMGFKAVPDVLGGGLGEPIYEQCRSLAEGKDWNDRRILLIRPGGLGALMFVGCVVRQIKHRWPRSCVMVSCSPGMGEVFNGLPYPDGIEEYPLRLETAAKYDVVIPLEGATEWGPDAMHLHIADCFARACGLELPEEPFARVPAFVVSEAEQAAALARYPRSRKPRVALQVFGSCGARSYPLNQTQLVVNRLTDRGWEVMLLGLPGSVPGGEGKKGAKDRTEGIFNCAADKLTFRESAGVVATSDVVTAPDSVWTHVAGALGMPAVALYGSEPWMLRTMHYARTRALTGDKCKLAPCHFWPKHPLDYPADGPCAKSGLCEELAGITVERIVAAVEKVRPTQRLAT
jgi:ADP-heptose:LPS heptosyltransferase